MDERYQCEAEGEGSDIFKYSVQANTIQQGSFAQQELMLGLKFPGIWECVHYMQGRSRRR